MKIIQANKFYYLRGGAEKYMLDLSAWLMEQGQTVVPFAMASKDNLPTHFSPYFPRFVQTEKVGFDPGAVRTFGRMLYSFESKRKMARLISHTKPDLCHVHNIYSQLSPSILDALSAASVPTVMTVHDYHLVSPQYSIPAEGCGVDYSQAGLFRASASRFHKGSFAASFAQTFAYKFHRALRMYERKVDVFIAPCDFMRRRLIAGFFPAEKIQVLHYGIDPQSIVPRYDHDGYMLYVGRLVEEKGVQTVIELARALPDIRFKIVGTGPDETRLHKLGHGLPNLEFIGFKVGDELRELYRGATAILIPSRWHEVFPLILLEAMAAGKPIIASHVGGIPEVVEDRVTGLLVQPLDFHTWTESVLRLAYDDDLRRQLSKNARLAVETTFHIRRHHEGIMRIYGEVMR